MLHESRVMLQARRMPICNACDYTKRADVLPVLGENLRAGFWSFRAGPARGNTRRHLAELRSPREAIRAGNARVPYERARTLRTRGKPRGNSARDTIRAGIPRG
jgi:hypothetical protein